MRLVGQDDVARRELVEAHLERVAAHNGVINAIVETRGEAELAEAAAPDRDTDVGVKCTCQRGLLANQSRTSFVLWVE